MAVANIYLEWSDFKDIVSNKAKVRYLDRDSFYAIYYTDEGGVFETSVLQDSGSDQTDFETNYQPYANVKVEPQKDSDGAYLQRTKVTTTGWHYQYHGIEFETSKLNSLYSKKVDGTNYGFTTLKFYEEDEGDEIEITGGDLNQTYLDSNCIKTVVEWEPTYDIEIIGGMLRQITTPTSDIRLWVVGVPDVAAEYGGSKPFATSVNLAFIDTTEGVRVDGRAPKFLAYNATYHTSKIQLILRHPAGTNHRLHMIFELFKA